MFVSLHVRDSENWYIDGRIHAQHQLKKNAPHIVASRSQNVKQSASMQQKQQQQQH